MIKFKIEMDSDDSSSIYSASGNTPMALIDDREKKKFLKVRLPLHKINSNRKRSKSAASQTSSIDQSEMRRPC